MMSPLINFQKTFSCENIFHAPSSIVVICSLDKNKDVWRHISCRSVRCFSTSVKLASRGRLQYKLNAGSEKITIAQLLITKLLLKGQFRIKAAFSYQRKVSLRRPPPIQTEGWLRENNDCAVIDYKVITQRPIQNKSCLQLPLRKKTIAIE